MHEEMNEEERISYYKDFKKAGKLAKEVREYGKTLIKKDGVFLRMGEKAFYIIETEGKKSVGNSTTGSHPYHQWNIHIP